MTSADGAGGGGIRSREVERLAGAESDGILKAGLTIFWVSGRRLKFVVTVFEVA